MLTFRTSVIFCVLYVSDIYLLANIFLKYSDAYCLFRFYYKFIVNGQWRHSSASPAERDERGNVNNVIVIGDTASVKPSVQQQKKVSTFSFLSRIFILCFFGQEL